LASSKLVFDEATSSSMAPLNEGYLLAYFCAFCSALFHAPSISVSLGPPHALVASSIAISTNSPRLPTVFMSLFFS